MVQGAVTGEGGHDTGLELVELSVVLVADQADPSILNPDFLRYKGIVDEKIQLKEVPLSTPVLSQVVFDSGLTVRAEANRFVFEQSGDTLSEDRCVVPETAHRFLDVVSHISWTAIGINPKGIMRSTLDRVYDISNALVERGERMSFKDVRPEIRLKVEYKYEARRITLDVNHVEIPGNQGPPPHGLFFQANIHRGITGETHRQRLQGAANILASWEQDVADFRDLVTKFDLAMVTR